VHLQLPECPYNRTLQPGQQKSRTCTFSQVRSTLRCSNPGARIAARRHAIKRDAPARLTPADAIAASRKPGHRNRIPIFSGFALESQCVITHLR